MKFKLRKNKKYKRINSILYEDFDKILKFTQSFPVDIPEMNEYSIKYVSNFRLSGNYCWCDDDCKEICKLDQNMDVVKEIG
jgi:hypothetical protein